MYSNKCVNGSLFLSQMIMPNNIMSENKPIILTTLIGFDSSFTDVYLTRFQTLEMIQESIIYGIKYIKEMPVIFVTCE